MVMLFMKQSSGRKQDGLVMDGKELLLALGMAAGQDFLINIIRGLPGWL